jgi:hypothetical protein
MNIIKNELFKNIAEMNGLSLENVNSSQNHRTKLVKVQDSLVFPSQSESNSKLCALKSRLRNTSVA